MKRVVGIGDDRGDRTTWIDTEGTNRGGNPMAVGDVAVCVCKSSQRPFFPNFFFTSTSRNRLFRFNFEIKTGIPNRERKENTSCTSYTAERQQNGGIVQRGPCLQGGDSHVLNVQSRFIIHKYRIMILPSPLISVLTKNITGRKPLQKTLIDLRSADGQP